MRTEHTILLVVVIGLSAWSAMLTGAFHDKHGVITNGYENPNVEKFPHFFHRIKKYNPELQTFTASTWDPIHKILQEGDADWAEGFCS